MADPDSVPASDPNLLPRPPEEQNTGYFDANSGKRGVEAFIYFRRMRDLLKASCRECIHNVV